MSEVLYRKYRPKNFRELVGQDQVKEILTRALETGKLAHAYIFSGSRGTGKTSTARILAKTLNCLSDGEKPCGFCSSCQSIDNSNHMDVMELDAASYRGIDEIRKIRDAAAYRPVMGKYKVYIIDEFHMLTREAFNAILKTLEEPPDKVVFILATTNLEKVPDTILSRCQIFNFKPLNEIEISEYLRRVCGAEEIECTPEGVNRIALAARGGMRDAVNLMERVITFHGVVNDEAVRDTLGVMPDEIIDDYLSCIGDKDWSRLTGISSNIVNQGYSYEVLLEQATERIKNMITGSKVSIHTAAELIAVLWDISRELKYSDNKRSTFEVMSIIKGSQLVGMEMAVDVRKSTIAPLQKSAVLESGQKEIVETVVYNQEVGKDSLSEFIDYLYFTNLMIPWVIVNLANIEDSDNGYVLTFKPEDLLAENLAKQSITELSALFEERLGKPAVLHGQVPSDNDKVLDRLSSGEREYVKRIMNLFGNGKNIDLEIEEEETHG